MARPQKFNTDEVISATTHIIAKHGPHSASIAKIAKHLNAPTGSIYHRYNSRSHLLGNAWLEAAQHFQSTFVSQLESHSGDMRSAGLLAVRSIPLWVRNHPDQARVLLMYRVEDFLINDWSEPMKRRAKRLNTQLTQGMRQFSKEVFGNSNKSSMRIVSYALADAPIAALKKHIEKNEPPPAIVDELIAQTYRGALALKVDIN